MTLEHKCKFCGAPVTTLQMDCEGVELFGGMDYWKNLAACNRCADFREKKRLLEEQLVEYAVNWNRHKLKQIALKPADLAHLMDCITKGAMRYADLVCRFHRVTYVWQPDFAQQLLDFPHNTMKILRFYERTISGPAEEAQAEPTLPYAD